MANTKFNSSQYAWSDVTVQIGARVLTGIQGIAYKETQEKDFVYGKGNKPLAIQHGNFSYEGSIKVLQSELEALIDAAPNKKLNDYRGLTITVGYETKEGDSVTDIIKGVEFTEVEKALEQGAQYMEVELPILFLDIQNNA